MKSNTIEASSPCCGSSSGDTGRILKSLGWLAFTTAVYLVCHFFLKANAGWGAGTRIAVTLTPLLPGLFYFSRLLKSYQAMDELQRRIQLEAFAIAFVGTLLATTGLNILHANGVALNLISSGLQIGGIYISVFIFWCLGSVISSLRYR